MCSAEKVGLILLAGGQHIFFCKGSDRKYLGFADPTFSFAKTQVFFIVRGYFHAMEELSLYMSFVCPETEDEPNLAHGA